MLFTFVGNFGKYSLLQHGHNVFTPTYCVVCVITLIDIKSRATFSRSTVLHPQVHVATFETLIISFGFFVTVGADLL